MSKSTVLIIEDDNDLREGMEELISSEGYHVLTARDGQAGISLLNAAANPSLILLDVKMPHFNGTQFLTALKSKPEFQNIPVVFVSAEKPDSQAIEKADGFLVKPINLDAMYKVIKKYCA